MDGVGVEAVGVLCWFLLVPSPATVDDPASAVDVLAFGVTLLPTDVTVGWLITTVFVTEVVAAVVVGPAGVVVDPVDVDGALAGAVTFGCALTAAG